MVARQEAHHTARASRDPRKAHGAYFTPPEVAAWLVRQSVRKGEHVRVLDPTCGGGVFLTAALNEGSQLQIELFGADISAESLHATELALAARSANAHLLKQNFFTIPSPNEPEGPWPLMDAVVGNPPFIRYQLHAGESRRLSQVASARAGVKLSGLASAWAATLVHASTFLNPDGTLGMVLPKELLSVNYAEPIRSWLTTRFAQVDLITFDRLLFPGAQAQVVLLVAKGTGGTNRVGLHEANGTRLEHLDLANPTTEVPMGSGKWTSYAVAEESAAHTRLLGARGFVPLHHYGKVRLGTVTGANRYFALTEPTRIAYGLTEAQVLRICPPGSRHLQGSRFRMRDWERLRDEGERVWLLRPGPEDRSPGLVRYLREGERMGIPSAYKCLARKHWWIPPVAEPPDLLFTYMSNRFPRLVANDAGASCLNTLHGLHLDTGIPPGTARKLALLAMNSGTMLHAEMTGRSYGGGVLKMEPREAAALLVPSPELLERAWSSFPRELARLERLARTRKSDDLVPLIDEILLEGLLGLEQHQVRALRAVGTTLRRRRTPVSHPD